MEMFSNRQNELEATAEPLGGRQIRLPAEILGGRQKPEQAMEALGLILRFQIWGAGRLKWLSTSLCNICLTGGSVPLAKALSKA